MREKGRRAWPPRRSSKERILAMMWEGKDMLSGSVDFEIEGGSVYA